MLMKLYGSAATTTASVATVDIPQDIRILGLAFSITGDAGVAALGTWSLSFASTDQTNSNDTRSELFVQSIYAKTVDVENGFIPLDEAAYAGERLHLHFRLDSGTMTSNSICRLILITDAKEIVRRTARR